MDLDSQIKDIQTTKIQRKALKSLLCPTENNLVREVLFGGAKNGGKSFLGTIATHTTAILYPDTSFFVARETRQDLIKYTIPTFYKFYKANGMNLDDFCKYNGQTNVFTFFNNSRINLIDCSDIPSDPMFERFGSMENTAGWIEEGGEIAELAKENLLLSIGRQNNEKYNLVPWLLITCNPKKNWMYRQFYLPSKNGTLPQNKTFIKSLVTDNDFRAKGSEFILEGIKCKRDLMRLRYGEWEYDDDDNALMSFDKINDIFTNTYIQGDGNKYMSIDLAITNDNFVCWVWDGLKVIDYYCQQGRDEENIKTHVFRLKNKHNVPASNIAYDGDGLGMAFKKVFAGMVEIHNGTPLGKQYVNAKTHFEYQIADLINKGLIHIECKLTDKDKDELIEELQMVKVADSSTDGKLATLKKSEVKQLIGRSPDKFDALKYRMIYYIIWNK